jgi:DNA mismatch repair protein MutL
MGRIRVLPDSVADRIAAGEVVERPASVVKELVENALDAGARSVAVTIEKGGRRLVAVEDDGTGMDRDDALLALERHATSKLSRAEDLARVASLGFRGEALPSIASVSQLTLLTAGDQSGEGCRVVVHGGTIRKVEPAARPRGTTLEVRNLFFNTPARRKFLRSEATETQRIVEFLTNIALSRPGVRFELRSPSRSLLSAPPVRDMRERVGQIFGGELVERLLPVAGAAGETRVEGLVAPPDESRSTRGGQHVWVNGRILRDRTVMHALSEAYAEVLPRGRHPVVFLQLTLPAELLDVNVHPAKTEVRFVRGREVHDLVRDRIREALRGSGALSRAPGAWTDGEGREVRLGEAVGRFLSGGAGKPAGATPPPLFEPSRGGWTRSGHAVGRGEAEPAVGAEEPGAVHALAQYRNCYIVARDASGLLLVDQHVAHERVLFEKLMAAGAAGEAPRQKLLFQVQVELPPAQALALKESREELERLGLGVEDFGGETVVVREIPGGSRPEEAARLVADVAAALAEGEGPGRPEEARRRAAATTACHAAVKINDPLTLEKMDYILEELFRCRTPTHCPHGRPIVLRITLEEIERAFGRI